MPEKLQNERPKLLTGISATILLFFASATVCVAKPKMWAYQGPNTVWIDNMGYNATANVVNIGVAHDHFYKSYDVWWQTHYRPLKSKLISPGHKFSDFNSAIKQGQSAGMRTSPNIETCIDTPINPQNMQSNTNAITKSWMEYEQNISATISELYEQTFRPLKEGQE